MTDTCTFCRVNIGSRRPAPVSPSNTSFTPRSRRAQPRPRITPPSSPTLLSPPARPRRVRTRPRHFDSSPDLDIPRRCEKANHVPLKAAHDFIDAGGRMHPSAMNVVRAFNIDVGHQPFRMVRLVNHTTSLFHPRTTIIHPSRPCITGSQ